jgi:hypothetical protein
MAYCEVRALDMVGRVSVSVSHDMVVFALSKEKDSRLYTTLDDWPAGEKIGGFLTFSVDNATSLSSQVNEVLVDASARAEATGVCVYLRLINYLNAISNVRHM